MGCQEAGDSKSLGKHERIMTAVVNLWLLCAGCKPVSYGPGSGQHHITGSKVLMAAG